MLGAKRQRGVVHLDRYSGGDCGGTSTTLRGTFEISGTRLTLRASERVTIEDDATRDVHEEDRSPSSDVITAALEKDGAEVTFPFQGRTFILVRLGSNPRPGAATPSG